MENGLDKLVDSIAKRLIGEGFTVQRYNAYTTNSIYLKLDYGVCNSIRISDHPGKKHLKYRYNIGSFVKEYQEEKDKYDRYYYRIDKAENMIKKIIKDRDFKKSRYGESGYKALMQKNKRDNAAASGFWSKAVLLN
ncbi:MAG: hypothetical protein HFI75_08700 [Lachnospiraceae bacterium]|nr:hypothetical protein [Lachnospiraceae bacterium]